MDIEILYEKILDINFHVAHTTQIIASHISIQSKSYPKNKTEIVVLKDNEEEYAKFKDIVKEAEKAVNATMKGATSKNIQNEQK